ncbi:hypothetical protein LZC95_12610 [Pendulispora brunnea]|uniref:Uncharacterized protein n=1 Tax=Pendulispora brunnea TaxID=2905690 RepID=A0ABZ2KMU9_9BACT
MKRATKAVVALGLALVSMLAPREAAADSSSLPPPKVNLTLATDSLKRWTMRLENTGEAPLRIVADPYLLSFEIMIPEGAAPSKGKKPSPAHTVRCSLPASMRPSSDLARGLVLLPGKAYSEPIDPRMYCFGTKEVAGLVRGARVIAHYGFTPPRGKAKPVAPFVVTPVASAERAADVTIGSLKEVIAASAVELSDAALSGASGAEATATSPDKGKDVVPVASRTTSPVTEKDSSSSVAPSASSDGLDHAFSIALPARTDGFLGRDVSVTVTLTNVGTRRASVYFRPQSVAFDVIGPDGEFTCPAMGAGAIRELFTTISPRGRAQVVMLPSSSCPDHAFDLPGLYEVRPRLDTRRIAGSPAGLHAFDGEAAGTWSLLRIRTGKPGVSRPAPTVE